MDYEWMLSASKGEIAFWFAVSLAYTIALYGAGPLLFGCLRKKPIKPKKLALFSVLYTFFAWMASNMVQVMLGGEFSNGGAALLWGGIFYSLLKRNIAKKSLLAGCSKTTDAPQREQPEERWYTCQKCGQLVREGEECDCEQVAPAQEEQPRSGAKAGGQRCFRPIVALSVVCVMLVVCSCVLGYQVYQFRDMAVAAIQENDRLLRENKTISEALRDLSEENSALKDRAGESENPTSFSEWATAPYSMLRWQHLYDAGYIRLSYEEWQQFTAEMHDGVASEFLREKAREQREKADREYGPTAYGSTCWDLWYKLTDAGHTTAAFDDFVEAYKLNTDE